MLHFESIDGLCESFIARIEEIEDDKYLDIPLVIHARENFGVLYNMEN